MKLYMHISLTELAALPKCKDQAELLAALTAKGHESYGLRALKPDETGHMNIWINADYNSPSQPQLGMMHTFPVVIDGD